MIAEHQRRRARPRQTGQVGQWIGKMRVPKIGRISPGAAYISRAYRSRSHHAPTGMTMQAHPVNHFVTGSGRVVGHHAIDLGALAHKSFAPGSQQGLDPAMMRQIEFSQLQNSHDGPRARHRSRKASARAVTGCYQETCSRAYATHRAGDGNASLPSNTARSLAARAVGEPASNNNPASRGSNNSGVAPAREPSTGVPQARVSAVASPKPSKSNEGMMPQSAAASKPGNPSSGTHPNRRTRWSKPSWVRRDS